MYYNVKKMCIKSSPLGEGKGEGPVGFVLSHSNLGSKLSSRGC